MDQYRLIEVDNGQDKIYRIQKLTRPRKLPFLDQKPMEWRFISWGDGEGDWGTIHREAALGLFRKLTTAPTVTVLHQA